MKMLRTLLLGLGLLLVLGAVNRDILRKEDTLANGRLILLELRPVDPRSLMQGDYMQLRYAPTTYPPQQAIESLPARGTLVLKLDENGVGRFARMDDGSGLAADEIRLRYKGQSWQTEMRLGAEAYFFQEGQADLFAGARFGLLRVDDDGNSILVGLANENHRRLGAPATSN